jgi:glucose uptake protein GlcU
MKATPMGAVLANLLSAATRVLGYVLYAVLFAIYRQDMRFITLFACIGLVAGALLWWWL